MSADLLRRAAKEMRADSRMLEAILPRSIDYNLAVADLLDYEAGRVERHNRTADSCFGPDASDFYGEPAERFCAVARAYLGEAS